MWSTLSTANTHTYTYTHNTAANKLNHASYAWYYHNTQFKDACIQSYCVFIYFLHWDSIALEIIGERVEKQTTVAAAATTTIYTRHSTTLHRMRTVRWNEFVCLLTFFWQYVSFVIFSFCFLFFKIQTYIFFCYEQIGYYLMMHPFEKVTFVKYFFHWNYPPSMAFRHLLLLLILLWVLLCTNSVPVFVILVHKSILNFFVHYYIHSRKFLFFLLKYVFSFVFLLFSNFRDRIIVFHAHTHTPIKSK